MSYFNELTGFNGKDESADVLDLSGEDDSEAVRRLAAFLRAHSINVVRETGSAVMVEYHMRKFALAPKVQLEGLDRIVVHEFWMARPDAPRHDFIELANELNNKYNTGGFYVDDDGDLGYQTQMTFMDRVTWKELEAFLVFHEYSLLAVLMAFRDELQRFLT